ncbi:murein L,D-transpeptidase family protein [uncultured Pseudacidovorax sp.]|uniref:L,D-transpeptidase family protein n=1 Tax=uncultured Pseudacidovorax sp. TaxID=679313 RepID=UPI0025F3DA66|nr:L,D-transpeptidase [uncultured Pseudacidovorax sp.]
MQRTASTLADRFSSLKPCTAWLLAAGLIVASVPLAAQAAAAERQARGKTPAKAAAPRAKKEAGRPVVARAAVATPGRAAQRRAERTPVRSVAKAAAIPAAAAAAASTSRVVAHPPAMGGVQAAAEAIAPAVPVDAGPVLQAGGAAEAQLIEVYQLFGRGETQQALDKARVLVKSYPNFQLAQLVYGDLLATRVPPGAAARPDAASLARLRGNPALTELHEESRRRLEALRDRPPPGTVPSQFLALSQRSRYAIAVDASRSRLYLLENTANGLQLAADYYISVGKAGTDKLVEGDARTPLGVYYVTSNLDPRTLKDFYGAGALPINYPNPYDNMLGRTGSGIWLHGTPPEQFSRPPQASDGCVVLSNPDLKQILRKVQVGATPVVIARKLDWVAPPKVRTLAEPFETALSAWLQARSGGNEERLRSFYATDYQRASRRGPVSVPIDNVLRQELATAQGRNIQLKDTSVLMWHDKRDTVVATFGEVVSGERTGRTRRQYWVRTPDSWKLFHEDILG